MLTNYSCYTNHALDQFLQELLDIGINEIVRIGSRSQSQRLEALSLDNWKKKNTVPRNKQTWSEINRHKALLAGLEAKIGEICRQCDKRIGDVISKYLGKRSPAASQSIFGPG